MKVAMFPRQGDNPFLPILIGALERQGCDVEDVWSIRRNALAALHIHWLEAPIWGHLAQRLAFIADFRVRRILGIARSLRARGRPVVWTAHNLAPHDFVSDRHRKMYEELRKGFLPLVTDVICMSESVRQTVREEFPELENALFHVVRHPHYAQHFEALPQEVPLDIPDKRADRRPVMSTFGLLRPYKNIPGTIGLLRAMDRDFHFVVAGRGPAAEMDAIRDAIGGDPRFTFIARRLSDPEVAGLIRESDLVLFNFRGILNSGSVLASLSLCRPVLAPALGAITDLRRDIGPAWVQVFEGQISTADIEQALESLPRNGKPDLALFGPDLIARQHIEIYGATSPQGMD